MAARFASFQHFWEVQSEDLPVVTDSDKKILLIAKGWALEAWKAATELAEEKVPTTNSDSAPLLCSCGREIIPPVICDECERVERIAG